MITKAFMILLFVVSLHAQAHQTSWTIYYSTADCTPPVYTEYYQYFSPKVIAADVASQLQRSTAMNFKIEEYHGMKGHGIYLLLDDSKAYSSNEQARITSDNKTTVIISAKYVTGLSYGAYTFLNKLGFKYYLPGENWTMVPTRTSFFIGVLDTEYHPAFKHRLFFTNFPSVKGIDEEGRNKKKWLQWCQRNRMGSEFLFLHGHVGEQYNAENQALLTNEPGRLAEINGKKQFSISAKIDPTNKRSAESYSDWIAGNYVKQKMLQHSCFPDFIYQSADMGDGLNYCHSPECEKLFPSVSDQAFYLANLAAIKIRKIDSKAWVNVYAYTERADTPVLKLEKNIFTQVVADAYQFNASPAMLIKKWSVKTKSFANYGYMNETASSNDQPFYDLDGEIKKLAYCRISGSQGFTYETSPSSFSSALPQFFIMKYLCEPFQDAHDEINTFYKDCFSTCTPQIKKIFDTWYFNNSYTNTGIDYFTFMEDDLLKLANYMDDAGRQKNESKIVRRLEDLKVYFIYLFKLFELHNSPHEQEKLLATPGYQDAKIIDLLKFTWYNYNSSLFHNAVLGSSLAALIKDPATREKWNSASEGISNLLKPGRQIPIDIQFTQIKSSIHIPGKIQEYGSLPDSVLTKICRYTADSIRIQLIDAQAIAGYTGSIEVYNAVPGKIKIDYTYIPQKKIRANIGFISLVSDDYKVIVEKQVFSSNPQGSVTFEVKSKGHYRLLLSQNQFTPATFIILPGKSLLYINKRMLPGNSILYADTATYALDNKYLGIYKGSDAEVHYRSLCYDCTNTFHFYTSEGGKLSQQIEQQSPFSAYVITRSDILLFRTDFFRWSPVFLHTSPYFFYFRKPRNM